MGCAAADCRRRHHPHIAVIHGVEETDGIRGLVLELVEGETLADVLRRSDTSSRSGLRFREVLGYAHQIAEALEALTRRESPIAT